MKKLQKWESLLSQTHDLIRGEGSVHLQADIGDIIREMREERDLKFLDLKGEKYDNIIFSGSHASSTI